MTRLFHLPLLLAALPCGAAGLVEDFSTNPAAHGWQKFGDASLFAWNSDQQQLEVTWDSARPNSYFHRPLGNILTRSDDFALSFDLRLDLIQPGANPAKPSTFQIAAGFLNWRAATNAGFSRGTGYDSPNLVEFDYFPAADFIAATVSPAIISSNSQFATSFTYPLEMTAGDWFHIALTYTASNATLVTTMTRNGTAFGPIRDATLTQNFTDFRVDTVAIASYNDAGDSFGSILARGVVDNLSVTLPPEPVRDLSFGLANDVPRIEFTARTNWTYTLERAADLLVWNPVPPSRSGIEGRLALSDTNTPAGVRQFYRVKAERP